MLITFRNCLKNTFSLTGRLLRYVRKKKYLASQRIPWSIGYTEYKYDSIASFIDSAELRSFSEGFIQKGYGYRLDERGVEYPWFFSRLKDSDKNILDAGSVLNYKQLLSTNILKERNIYISTLFYEGRPDVLPSPSYIYEDLRSTCFRDEFFDVISSLSTLEHVGLDNTQIYTPDVSKRENDKYAYLKVVKEFWRILKPGGSVFISVPYGIYCNHGWFQVFDEDMVSRIVDTFAPSKLDKTYFKYENDQWNFSDEHACEDGTCFDLSAGDAFEKDYLAFSRCVVCLEMMK